MPLHGPESIAISSPLALPAEWRRVEKLLAARQVAPLLAELLQWVELLKLVELRQAPPPAACPAELLPSPARVRQRVLQAVPRAVLQRVRSPARRRELLPAPVLERSRAERQQRAALRLPVLLEQRPPPGGQVWRGLPGCWAGSSDMPRRGFPA